MTSNESLLENRHAVSSDMLYSLKASSVAGKSYRCSIPATNNTSFIQNNTMIFYISAGRRNTFLDGLQSYLKFTIQNNDATATANLDTTGANIINSISIYSGSNLLEQISNYNVLFNYIVDCQMNASDRYGSSACMGNSSTNDSTLSAAYPNGGYRQGAKLGVAGTNSKLTVAIPLLSSFFLGQESLLPVWALNDDIRIEITLESEKNGFYWSVAPTASPAYNVVAPELELTYIEISDEGMRQVQEVTDFRNPVFIHSNSWRHYTSTLPASATSGVQTMLVPARHASLKSIVVLPRPQTVVNTYTGYSLSCRVNPNFATYNFRIGSLICPQKGVTLQNGSTCNGYAEAYMELMKSFHNLSRASQPSILGMDVYNVADTVDTTVGNGGVIGIYGTGSTVTYLTSLSYRAGFAIALECELYANRSSVILSGLNCLSSQIFFETNILTPTAGTTGYTIDFYSNYDVIFVLENGLLSARQ